MAKAGGCRYSATQKGRGHPVANDALIDTCMAQLLADDAAARPLLAQAWQQARQAGDDATCWRLAALALLAINVDFADFRGLADWLARFADGEAAAPPLPRQVDRLRIDAAWLVRPTLDDRHDPADPACGAAAQRLQAALRDNLLPAGSETVLLAKALYDHLGLAYDSVGCAHVAAYVNPLVAAAATSGAAAHTISPAWQGRWWQVLEEALIWWGEAAAAEQAAQRVRHIVAQGTAGPALAYARTLSDLARELRDGAWATQDRLSAELDRLSDAVRPGILLRGLHWQAVLLARRQQPRAALERLDRVLRLSADLQVPERDQGLYREQRAYALATLQRWDEALAEVARLRTSQRGQQACMADAIAAALQACAARAQHAADAPALGLQALRQCAQLDWRRFLASFPSDAAWLCQLALDAGVEADFARTVVHERRLCPADSARADWPWRLHVRVLGPLQLQRDGVPLLSDGKAQKKPLELLALLAAQGSRPLATEAAIEALWPSLEANAPRASLDMAVSRLRKLLDVPDAVLLAEGRLQLNPALCWTDVAAFETRLQQAAAGVPDALADAVALYAAPLLGNLPLAGALQLRRQQLAQQFGQAVIDHARQLAGRGRGEAACQLLQRALLQDPSAEPLHRALIQLLLDTGEHAQAAQALQRCRSLLHQALGVPPSAATQALVQRLPSGF